MKILQLVKQDIDRERKSKQGLEKLSMAMKQTPTFGSDDSQQNVADKLYHVSTKWDVFTFTKKAFITKI